MATSVEIPQAPPATSPSVPSPSVPLPGFTPAVAPVRLTVALLSGLVNGGAFPGDYSAELVHGQYIVSPRVQWRHSTVMRNVFLALHRHVEPRGLGDVFPDGTCYALPHRDDTLRCPDVSFIAAAGMPSTPAGDGWLALAPDLVVEVRSPEERRGTLTQKLDDYFAAGTALAWVVDPRRWGVEVHTRDRTTRWVPAEGTLDGGPVLPDFRLAVADVFRGVARPS